MNLQELKQKTQRNLLTKLGIKSKHTKKARDTFCYIKKIGRENEQITATGVLEGSRWFGFSATKQYLGPDDIW